LVWEVYGGISYERMIASVASACHAVSKYFTNFFLAYYTHFTRELKQTSNNCKIMQLSVTNTVTIVLQQTKTINKHKQLIIQPTYEM